MPQEASDSILLEDLSPRDVKFDLKRCETNTFRDFYQGTAYDSLAERMNVCAPHLQFILKADDTGTICPKLHAAHFCRVRHCPMCQWRKSLMWVARALQVVPMVLAKYSKSRFIFMTLTVRNCELTDLKQTLTWMHKSWTKLVKRKEFAAVQGWLRSVEITRGVDDTAHPHYHVLLMVSPGYFGGNQYVSQQKWTQSWKECLQVEYTPIVDVRSVKPRTTVEGPAGEVAMLGPILETFKYSVKPSDCLGSDKGRRMSNRDWLLELTSQLHKTRAIATGGVLKTYMKQLEDDPEDLIHADGVDEVEADGDSGRLTFGWREKLNKYVLQEVC